MATMQDVAQRARVSLSTVSYVLSGKRPVSDDARGRVEQAMTELSFRPHPMARALASRRTHVLAVAYPVYGVALGATLNEIVAGAAEAARAADYELVLWPVSSAEPEVIQELAEQRTADGVLLMEVTVDDPRIAVVEQAGLACALIGRTADPRPHVWVDIDFDDALVQAVDHLAALGHRHIVFLTRPQDMYDAGYGPAVRSQAAFDRRIAELGLDGRTERCEVTPPAGRRAVQAILADAPEMTGIIVMNELALFGVATALREAGRRVPEDVSVLAVAVADEVSEMYDRPLTYLAAPGPEQGARAVRDLLHVLRGEPAPPGSDLRCVLQVRTTTGPAPQL